MAVSSRGLRGLKTINAELQKSALVTLVKPAQRGEGNRDKGVVTGRRDRGEK